MVPRSSRPALVRCARLALVGCAAVLAVAVVAASPPEARAKDDAAERKEKREEHRKKLKEEGKLPFFDLSYFFDGKAAKETRWTQTDPPNANAEEKKGVQFYATWTAKEGNPPLIRVVIQKFIAQEGNSTYSTPFEYAGFSAPCGDKKKMAEGFYLDWIKQCTEPVKEKCIEPKKATAAGPADLFASAVATDKESKKRERRDWYVWGGKATWVVQFAFPDYEMVEKAKLDERAAEFMKFLKEDKKAPD